MMTPELAFKIRSRIRELSKDFPVLAKLAAELKKSFPDFSLNTLKDYASVLSDGSKNPTVGIGDKTFGLYVDGKMSFTALLELGHSDFDIATKDFIAGEFVTRKMTLHQLKRVKGFLRDKRKRVSVYEAIARAVGEIPSFSKEKQASKVNRSFDELIPKFVTMSVEVRALAQEILDLLPVSAIDRGKVRADIFHKLYLTRHVFHEHFEFLDKRVKAILEQLVKFVSAEKELSEKRRETTNGTQDEKAQEDQGNPGGEDEGEVGVERPVHGAGPVLQDPSREPEEPVRSGEGDPGTPDGTRGGSVS